MDDFRFTTRVPIRYADLDPMNHVNNAVYATFFEEARGAYVEAVLGVALQEEDVVIANIEADFAGPLTRNDSPAEIGVRVPEVGRSSFPIEYGVRAGGERKATGATTLVCYDREADGARPLPDAWREAIVEYEGLDGA